MVNVAVHSATRLAFVEMLADEQKPTVIGSLARAVAWFNTQGIECRRWREDTAQLCVSAHANLASSVYEGKS